MEEARTERLDTALKDVETVIEELKYSSRRRDEETRRINDEVKSLKDAIPKALQGAREGNENRLKDLGTEMRSLKALLGNRLGASNGTTSPIPGRTLGASTLPAASRPADEYPTSSVPALNGAAAAPVGGQETQSQTPVPTQSPATAPRASPLPQTGRSPSIPVWQMAAADRSKQADSFPKPTPSAAAASSETSEQQQQNGTSA